MPVLFSIPDELPPDGVDAQTGLACPDCSGTLSFLLRKGSAVFRCRIGHAYSLPEVVGAMEESVERRLWNAVASLEELADFLDTAARRGFAQVDEEAYRQPT